MTLTPLTFSPRPRTAWRRVLFPLGLLAFAVLVSPRAVRAELGSGTLLIAGTQLTVSPESQTVPFSTPTIVETTLAGFDPDRGTLPADLRVVGDLKGPEIPGTLQLETRPGEPFRIPRFTLEGEYVLDDIRLVRGDRLLAYALPRSAVIRVTQILITRVTSRALTLNEIRSRGIVISGDNFKAFNFTFGFTVEGRTIDYDVPILWRPHGEPAVPVFGPEAGSAPVRFQPPQLAPFVLDLKPEPDEPSASGGCLDPSGSCTIPDPPPVPGVILFPTDSSLLHQFFSVVLMVQNGAPAGDRLVIRDLTAKINLPAGLRAASTEPPTNLGAPVPVHVPGPDGKVGTADDVTFLIAQAMGESEFLVEGLREGTHVVSIDLDGILEGLPTGIRRIGGVARGAVLVRDPRFAIHISHPDVIRRSELYTLRLSVSNVSNAPANLLSIGLPASGLSGAELVDPSQFRKTIETLLPGESQSVEFRLRALRTGRVTASAARTDATVTPTFDLVTGVGETGIPLSPNSIVLSRSSEALPPALVESALDLAGLGLSLAEAPAASLAPGLPQIGGATVDQRVWQLAQAGRHVTLGEDLFDSAAVLAAEWLGARDADWDWDLLRRTTATGGRFVGSVAQIFAAEIAAGGIEPAFERFASTTAFLPPLGGVLATGEGVRLDLSSRTSGRRLASGAASGADLRDLPFADLLHVPNGEWALLGAPEAGGYRARVVATQATTLELQLLVTAPGPELRVVRFRDVPLGTGGVATVEWTPAGGDALYLSVDRDGDGDEDDRIPELLEIVPPRTFAMVAAVQNARVDPTGHVVDVLFSGDVDLGSLLPPDPSHFQIAGKLSNGGVLPVEQGSYLEAPVEAGEPAHRNPFEGLRDTRVVQVVFNNPLSPYVQQLLSAGGVRSVLGEVAASRQAPVRITVTTPGGLVEGRVIGPDGAPLPFAQVSLTESDLDLSTGDCVRHKTAAVSADAGGAFLFDYVRQTECGAPFELAALDPTSEKRGTAAGRIRFVGNRLRLDIVLLGRGKIQGKVRYDDGTVPVGLTVVGYSPVFKEGRAARIDAAGNYDIGDLPVGTISLSATAGDGAFALATVAIPSSGATVERDLVLLRRPEEQTGEVRGIVVETDGTTPVVQAFVALYVNNQFLGVRRSDFSGRFEFGVVPAGVAEIQAFSAETGRGGAQIFFDVLADRTQDVRVVLVDERGVVEGHVYRRTLTGIVPVAGAVVYAYQTPFHTMSDATGAYRLENVFAGFQGIRAVDLANNQEASGSVNVRDGAVANLDLYFEENARGSIAGAIRDASGAAIGGATIHLATSDAENWIAEATADASGRFAFPSVVPGTYDVHGVRGDDGARARVTVRFAGDSTFADLRVFRGAIRGSVRAANGSGPPIGVVAVVRYRTTTVRLGLVGLDLSSHDIETQADGTFEIPNVLAGDYTLTVSNAFYGSRSFSGRITAQGQIATHDVLFEPNGQIAGTILDYDGVTPIAGALVRLVHPNFFHDPTGYEVRSGVDGRFLAEFIPPTPNAFPIDVFYDDGAVHRSARAWVRFTQAGQRLDVPITLLQQAAVRGWVEDADGVRVPLADVVLRGANFPNQTLSQQTDETGAFSFANVLEGPVTVSATAPGLGGLSGKTATAVVSEGSDIEGVVVRLEPTGEIRGRLLSPVDGLPVSGATVILVRFGKLLDSATSDDQGGFAFRLLPLAPYRIEASDPRTGRQGRKENLQLTTNGQVLDVDVVLEARGEVVGHLVDPSDDTPVPGAPVQMYSNGIITFATYSSTDALGAYEFLGVPQGHFSLLAYEPGGRRKAMGEGTIASEGERVTVDLALEPQGVVYGSVLRPTGQPAGLFTPSNVVLYQDGQRIAATLDNPFRFEGVIVGHSFELWVTEPGGDHIGRVRGMVTAPGEEVRADVPMQSVATVEVEVVNGSGVPVPGVEVRGLTTMLVLNSPSLFGNGVVTGTTNSQGIVTFPRLHEGTIQVLAHDPVSQLGGQVSGIVSLDGVTTRLRLMLEASGVVKGRFVTSDGTTPAAGALVILTSRPGTLGGYTLRQAAAADGSWSFPAKLGIFTIDATEDLGPGRFFAFGQIVSSGQVFDFGTLRLDDENPRLLGVEPVDGAIGVPVLPAIRVRFSEPVQPLQFVDGMVGLDRVASDTATGQAIPKAITFADGGATLVVTPAFPLDSFTRYRVSVEGDKILDLAGRGLTSGRTVSFFNTADVIPPSVVSVSPASGALEVPLNTEVRLTFSEPLGTPSLDGSPFQLFDQTVGAGVSTAFVVENGNRDVVLTPLAPLADSHVYQIRATGVRDAAGNVMPAYASIFATIDLTPPTIVLSVPSPIYRDVSVTLSAAPVASSDVATVRFYRDGQLIGTVNSAAPDASVVLAYLPTAADETAGTVTFGAEAVDRVGNVGPRVSASATVEPPRIALSVPASVVIGVPVSLVVNPVVGPAISSVRFYRADQLLGTVNASGSTPPFTRSYTPTAADLAAGTVTFAAEAVYASGRVGPRVSATSQVAQDSSPPQMRFLCPEPSVRSHWNGLSWVAPSLWVGRGQRVHFVLDATDQTGVARVETTTTSGTQIDTTAPYEFDVTIGSSASGSFDLTFTATDTLGIRGSITRRVTVIAGAAVLTADETLGGDRPNPYVTSPALVVPSGRTLTLDGTLELNSLIVGDGGRVVVAPATASTVPEAKLFLFSGPSLWVACQGVIDASGRGFLGGQAGSQSAAGAPGRGVGNDPAEGAPPGAGGSHGGRGGAAAPGSHPLAGAPFDSAFWPLEPGGGGGGGATAAGTAGGGAIQISGFGGGEMVIDGAILANGASGAGPTGAGGSIVLADYDVPKFYPVYELEGFRGAGRLEASGGNSTSNGPTGGGGRIALWGRFDSRFRDRAVAAGGATGSTSALDVGAAGTIYHNGIEYSESRPDQVTPDPLPTETLKIDNAGRTTAHATVLPSAGTGIVTSLASDPGAFPYYFTFTDAAADFRSSLFGGYVLFGPGDSTVYRIEPHPHHTDSLSAFWMENVLPPAGFELGTEYRGWVRLDGLDVRRGARFDAAASCQARSVSVDATSALLSDCRPPVGFETPTPFQRFAPGATITVRLTVRSDVTLASATATFDGQSVTDDQAPFEWTFTAVDPTLVVGREILVDALDDQGVVHALHLPIVLLTQTP